MWTMPKFQSLHSLLFTPRKVLDIFNNIKNKVEVVGAFASIIESSIRLLSPIVILFRMLVPSWINSMVPVSLL